MINYHNLRGGLGLRQLRKRFEPKDSIFIENEKVQSQFAQNYAKDDEIEMKNSKCQKIYRERREEMNLKRVRK